MSRSVDVCKGLTTLKQIPGPYLAKFYLTAPRSGHSSDENETHSYRCTESRIETTGSIGQQEMPFKLICSGKLTAGARWLSFHRPRQRSDRRSDARQRLGGLLNYYCQGVPAEGRDMNQVNRLRIHALGAQCGTRRSCTADRRGNTAIGAVRRNHEGREVFRAGASRSRASATTRNTREQAIDLRLSLRSALHPMAIWGALGISEGGRDSRGSPR